MLGRCEVFVNCLVFATEIRNFISHETRARLNAMSKTYFTELLGISHERALTAIEDIERGAQVARAAATLHEIRRIAFAQRTDEASWTTLSDLDKRWWAQVSALQMLPEGSWRQHEWGEVQLRFAALRLDQLPPSVMLHFYWPQALAIVHAMTQPNADIVSISRAAFEATAQGKYDEADPDILAGTRRVTTVVLYALGAADGIIGV